MSTVSKINETKRKAELALVTLLYKTIAELMRRVETGEASPQDISNAIRLCKENDITIDIKEGDASAVLEGVKDLPFMSDNVVNFRK